jgi:hypothetical protein
MPHLNRRQFLATSALAAFAGPTILPATKKRWARPRPDLLDAESPKGLEVVQLTSESEVPSSHLYMEAQIFTPDSKRLLVHRSASAHGSSQTDPKHQYLVCDLTDNYALTPLTTEVGATAPSVSPDGRFVYYFVNETQPGGGRLTLKRVNFDGTQRQTVLVIDKPLPDTKFRPSRIYPLSTISSDGMRLALSCFLGDGQTPNAPYGMMVFDLLAATVRLVIHGTSWCNMHPQYCRSQQPDAAHDILIQENHDNTADATGVIKRLVGGAGADIHVIRDDGTNFRNMPWGRDGNEGCQGHQCWRGRSPWAITSTGTRKPPEAQLIEGRAAPHAGHVGSKTPGGLRNDLSRSFPNPHFAHFATDIAGRHLITDAKGGFLYVADLGEPGKEPLRNWRRLLATRSSMTKQAHIHPFLSPDGTMGFFNSDETGLLQAYLVKGWC